MNLEDLWHEPGRAVWQGHGHCVDMCLLWHLIRRRSADVCLDFWSVVMRVVSHLLAVICHCLNLSAL